MYSGKQFRDEVQVASKVRNKAYDLLEDDKDFADIYKALNDPARVKQENRFDVALYFYINDVLDDTETNGEYDYDKVQRNTAEWKATWGDQEQNIQQYFALNRAGEPEAIAELRKAKQTMSAYFGIKDTLLNQSGLKGVYDALRTYTNTHPLLTDAQVNDIRDRIGLTPILDRISQIQRQVREQNNGQNIYNYYYQKYYS